MARYTFSEHQPGKVTEEKSLLYVFIFILFFSKLPGQPSTAVFQGPSPFPQMHSHLSLVLKLIMNAF